MYGYDGEGGRAHPERWLEAKQLKLALQKKQAVLLVRKRRVKQIKIRVKNAVVQSEKRVRHLGSM